MNRATRIVAIFAFATCPRLWACASCFGDPNDPQTHGMNAAILTLLGVTYGLFLAMFAMGFVIWRRSVKNRAAIADESTSPAVAEPLHD
jgi:hypothetical protein